MGNNKGLALVTGASAGIGAAYAGRLAARGYDLLLVARRRDRLETLARELERKHPVRAEVLPADLTQRAYLKAVEDRMVSANNLAFLVNNAGIGIRGRFEETDLERQEQMHQLHIVAPVRLTHAALRGMVARRNGVIVNVSSSAAFAQSPWNTTYNASKTWMNAFTEALWLEMKADGVPVKVQALCPGFTVTEFHDVMGVDRKIVPDSWWMTSEEVVDASLRGLERGKLIVIPGWRYKAYFLGLTLMPSYLRRRLTVMMARKVRNKMAGHEASRDVRQGS